jgi:hypothetical protein
MKIRRLMTFVVLILAPFVEHHFWMWMKLLLGWVVDGLSDMGLMTQWHDFLDFFKVKNG